VIYEFGRWIVRRENSKNHRETLSAIYAYIKSNRERFPYLRSSHFYTTNLDGQAEEAWIYLDSYRDSNDYDMMSTSLLKDERAFSLRKTWEALIVPNSYRTEIWSDFAHELWIGNDG